MIMAHRRSRCLTLSRNIARIFLDRTPLLRVPVDRRGLRHRAEPRQRGGWFPRTAARLVKALRQRRADSCRGIQAEQGTTVAFRLIGTGNGKVAAVSNREAAA